MTTQPPQDSGGWHAPEPPFRTPIGGSLGGSPDPTQRLDDPFSPSTRRPWWGFGDVLLGFVVFFVGSFVGAFIGLPFLLGDALELTEVFSGEMVAGLAPVIAFSLLTQQFFQAAWPLVVSRWKGLGPAADWRLAFAPIDLAIGLGTGLIGLVAAGAVGWGLTQLVGLDDANAADNTEFLRSAEGTPWLWIILFCVVVGAPVAEELFFRGLTLRAVEKRLGTAAAVIFSSVIFALPHFIGSGLKGTIVLLGSIFTVGVVLAVAAVQTNRLAAPIIAHMVFNAVGAYSALAMTGT